MVRVKVTYPSLTKMEVVETLRRALANLEKKLPLSIVILFGSFARDRYTAGSDIDLLVVYKGQERVDAFKVVMDEVRLPRLEPRIYTEEQFNGLLAGSPKFAEVLTEEGITIFTDGERRWLREAKTG
ncbi:MAG: nucleotidyltransferase domain-containing protein [Candidatus Bathyarchaeia archaeon]